MAKDTRAGTVEGTVPPPALVEALAAKRTAEGEGFGRAVEAVGALEEALGAVVAHLQVSSAESSVAGMMSVAKMAGETMVALLEEDVMISDPRASVEVAREAKMVTKIWAGAKRGVKQLAMAMLAAEMAEGARAARGAAPTEAKKEVAAKAVKAERVVMWAVPQVGIWGGIPRWSVLTHRHRGQPPSWSVPHPRPVR